MPWDPTPQPSSVVADDPVPYDDMDVTVYEEDFDPTTVPPSPRPAPAPVPEPAVAPAPAPADGAPLPSELASIASMLEDAFGQSIRTVIEENGEDADEMLDDDADGEGGAFTDEPVYDGDEYADDDE